LSWELRSSSIENPEPNLQKVPPKGILANYASRMRFLNDLWRQKPNFTPFLPIWEAIVYKTDEI
jgi:hypothetical protein